MSRLSNLYLPVAKAAQRLGLVAPCKVKLWDNWWAETRFKNGGRPCEIVLSEKLLNPLTRIWVLSGYSDFCGRTTAAGLFAHELGHVFRYNWIKNRSNAPLKGYRELFGNRVRFDDPWNDMVEYLSDNPDRELDTDQYLSWYARCDHEEDFCECFAELVMAGGDCSAYRGRPGVYRKMVFIREAGKRILDADPVLRHCCRKGWDYLSAGETLFTCPRPGHQQYGVPDIPDSYVCPCGGIVEHDGRWIKHE